MTPVPVGRPRYRGPRYPNAWDWVDAMRSVSDKRTLTEKGDHGEHGDRVFYRYRSGTGDDQAYCVFCRFHPWMEEGVASHAWVTVERPNGERKRVLAVREGDELVARFDLEPDQRAYVDAGDLYDVYGNTNGQRSAVITG